MRNLWAFAVVLAIIVAVAYDGKVQFTRHSRAFPLHVSIIVVI